MDRVIYLDYNATTPVDPEVQAVMEPFLKEYFANASSRYAVGVESRKAVELARAQVAALIGASPAEIVFTSGGSESDNHALKGAAFAAKTKGNHIIVSSVEHPAVLEVCSWLKTQGFRISYLPVNGDGLVQVHYLEKMISPATVLVSVMHANNEVGTIQPVAELARVAHSYGAIFHTDAAQSAGKIKVDVDQLGVDLLTLAAHKLYGPKGIGALYIRKGVHIESLIHGSSQEHNQRAGTENLLEIAGFGKAAEIAARDLLQNQSRLQHTRDLLAAELKRRIPAIHINGNPELGLPNTLSVSFPGIPADTLLSALPHVAASAGAACHSEGVTVSHVLEAMHIPASLAAGTVRFSTGKSTDEHEIRAAAETIGKVYKSLVGESQAGPVENEGAQVRLTQFTHGLGCACKIRPSDLESILKKLPPVNDSHVLVGSESSDDAAVYLINSEQAIVQTLDFFTPIVDDPYDFGAIAAANALSDIYAMGARPLFGLNIVAFPVQRLPMHVLEQILKGASDKASEAGISIVGGHSIDDIEPKFGMCITGIVDPEKIWKNTGAKPGDCLILTKPLGTGIISTAIKSGLAGPEAAQEAVQWMKQLNRKSAEALAGLPVNSCTDITGFGLAGHLHEMTAGSGVDAAVKFGNLPFMQQVQQLALAGAIPGGTRENLSFYESKLRWDGVFSETEKLMFADAQTSGGLLLALPAGYEKQAMQLLKQAGIASAAVIGHITGLGKGLIHIS